MVTTSMKQKAVNMLCEIAKVTYTDLKNYTTEKLSEIAEQGSGDVVYRIDVKPEYIVEKYFQKLGNETTLLGISEKTGAKIYGEGDPKHFAIVDPLDGTRHVMYQLQDTAFSLVGLGKVKESEYPKLGDINFCAMLQVPNLDKKYVDLVIAEKGKGTKIERYEVETWEKIETLKPTPSKAETIAHGFVAFTSFFPPRKYLTEIADYVVEKIIGPIEKGKAPVFFHEYISNAGQFYYLLTGKYRMVADLRPLQEEVLKKEGKELGLCAHPYDVCCALALKEAGCVITDGFGSEEGFWNYPCDTKTDVHFIAYANEKLYKEIAPVVVEAIEKLWDVKPPKR